MTSKESAAQETNTASSAIPWPELPPIAPTAKRLFLVRHGEVINPGGDRPVFYGAMDVSLSPLGEEEARAAAQFLQQHDLQHVACSPLTRAIFGAEQVLELQGSESDLIILEGFKELDRGAWCGLTIDEIGPDMMEKFNACDESVTPDGGESFLALKNRVLQARDTILELKDPGRASAVISHLQVTRSILSDALGVPTNNMALLKVATASVTCIDYCTATGSQTVHFQSFKPDAGLQQAKDGAN
jgi:probable phosphoglycerate mutase